MGGQRYWNDGREVYDLILGLLDYPETKAHPAFTLALQTDFEDGGGANSLFRFVGSDGVIDVTFRGLKVSRVGIEQETPEQVLKGYNSVVTFSKAAAGGVCGQAGRRGERRASRSRSSATRSPSLPGARAATTSGYDHFVRFFRSIREGAPVEEDAIFGYRAAAPALLCNDSYRQGKMIGWDPVAMRIVP